MVPERADRPGQQHVGHHPGRPGQADDPRPVRAGAVLSQTSTSSNGQGRPFATAPQAYDARTRPTTAVGPVPGAHRPGTTVGSGAKPLKPTVEYVAV